MQASRLADGHRGFAFGFIQAYVIVLVTCGALALGFTGRFLWNTRAEFPSLVKIIRYRAAEDDDDIDLENGKYDVWDFDSTHSNEDDAAGAGYGDTETEEEYGPRGWTYPRGYGNLDWNNGGKGRRDDDDSPADDEAEEDNAAGSGNSDAETEDEYDPHNDGEYICTEDHRHGWTCPRNYFDIDCGNGCGNERTDDDDWPGHVELLDNEGEGDNEAEENNPAGLGQSDAETEEEYDPQNDGDYICTEDHRHGWTCPREYGDPDWNNRCDHEGRGNRNGSRSYNPWDYDSPRYNNEGDNNEDEADDQHDCPEPKNGSSDALHLTPSSSGSNAEVNTTNPAPLTFENWYATPADDTESCSSCDSEHTKTIPSTTPAAYREPLTPTSPTEYVAGVEDNDDGEESDVSDGATIEEPEGEDSETWNNGDSSISYGLTSGHGFQSEREDTGPLGNVQEPNELTTGTAFSPPHLPARHANILADETSHGQSPPVGEFRHGIARPLRLTIPTQGIVNAEPGASTTPANTQWPAQWPGTAYAGNSWRDV